MRVKKLIELLNEASPHGTMEVKISQSLLDENGVDIEDVLVQEYDDGEIINEVVIMGYHDSL